MSYYKDDERSIYGSVLEAKPAAVEYVGHCRHMDTGAAHILTTASLKENCVIFGLTIIDYENDVVRVCCEIDEDSNDDGSYGLIIPRSCVIEITWLVAEDAPEAILKPTKKKKVDIN